MFVELNISKKIPKNGLTNKIIKLEMLRYFRLNLNEEVRNHWDSYFKSTIDPKVNCDTILRETINSMRFTTVEGKYVVLIDGKHMVNGTDYTLDSLLKLFNYGNLSIKGSHLISNAFDYLKHNIAKILLIKYFGVFS